MLIALLQPPPEVYDLFDDVMLMSEGTLVYHGPREDIAPFFRQCGFAPPARKGVADFLQEVTSRKDQGVRGCAFLLLCLYMRAFAVRWVLGVDRRPHWG